jgi:rod shape-determining protein MreD
MSGVGYVRLALVVLLGVVVQVSILTNLRIAGMHPEIIWLFPLCAGLIAGSELGSITGFGAGLALDCLQPTPFGLTALVATLVGFFAGLLAERSGFTGDGSAWWVTPGLGVVASVSGTLIYGLLGFVFGEDQFTSINYLVLVPVVAVAAGLFAIPVWFLVNWAIGDATSSRRVTTEVTSW